LFQLSVFSGSSFLFGAREEPCATFVSVLFFSQLHACSIFILAFVIHKLLSNTVDRINILRKHTPPPFSIFVIQHPGYEVEFFVETMFLLLTSHLWQLVHSDKEKDKDAKVYFVT